MWPRHIMPCVTLGTARLFILLSGTYHIYSARKNEEWAKLLSLDTHFLNDFCGFFKAVVFSENIKGFITHF